MKFKNLFIVSLLLLSLGLVACSGGDEKSITVVSREDGSGTRSAFVELAGVLKKDDQGKTDQTTEEAIIQMQTEGVIQTVSKDDLAIGYISTGSMSDRVKALDIDGFSPSQENIRSGDYKISRPFLLVTKEKNPLIEDFMSFIMSPAGQEIIGQDYIPLDPVGDYEPHDLAGKITIAGSTSVAPLMEKLTEAYSQINSQVSFEIQQPGSSAGIASALDATVDIGMSSRELTDDEASKLERQVIAIDGIAVIVNKNNSLDTISLDQLRKVFIGEILDWKELGGK